MQTKQIIKSIIFFVILPVGFSWAQLTGPYFNQPFPSTTVTRFAAGIFTEEFHAPPIFSPDGTEVYWNLMEPGYPHILYMKLENGIWSEPAIAPFCIGDFTDSPFLTSDGTKLFFLTMNQPAYEENICMVEKQNGEWGTPQILGNEVNQFDPHWQASAADNQNLYFGGRLSSSPGDIYFSEYLNNNYTLATKLGPAINTDSGNEGSPFIAPDESYLIFDRVAEGTYDADLFISFKQNDGNWSVAVNMSELNTGAYELYANVSPNGLFIMFLSGRTGILLPYWVDAQVINNYITGVDDEKNAENPGSFQLHQNYPNPFNPATIISYSIPNKSLISIKIYDMLGNEVGVLVDEEKLAGEYKIEFDGSKLTSGVYFYKLISSNFIDARKMILLK
jgi:hypothetical protein